MNESIEAIFKTQHPDGYWGERERFYTDKYKGTVWNVLILAELGADPTDPRVRRACEFLLDHSYESESGGFSVSYSVKYKSGLPSQVIPCLTGNMVFAMIRFGYMDDPRIQKAIDWIIRYQRTDDGVFTDVMDPKYANNVACFSTHTCFMGVVKSLKALAEIPVHRRTQEVNRKIEELSEFLLIHHIYKKSHDLKTIAKPGWTKFGFPLMYQTDVLEIVDIFRQLEIRDERLRDALDLIQSKETIEGWQLESTMNGKMLIDIGQKMRPCEYLTRRAQNVLKYYRQA
ncbi:MAG: nitrogen fixation protein NifH [Firmicutes bacterium]|nr:nitrogen fixation protein NifH [Bacillota bacterium]